MSTNAISTLYITYFNLVFIYNFMNKQIIDNDCIAIFNNKININGIGCYI